MSPDYKNGIYMNEDRNDPRYQDGDMNYHQGNDLDPNEMDGRTTPRIQNFALHSRSGSGSLQGSPYGADGADGADGTNLGSKENGS